MIDWILLAAIVIAFAVFAVGLVRGARPPRHRDEPLEAALDEITARSQLRPHGNAERTERKG